MNTDSIGWPSALVAVALILLVAAVTITAIIRYDVDGALKIWSSLGAVVAILTGAVVTYFFAGQAIAGARKAAADSQRQAEDERRRADEAIAALAAAAGRIDPAVWTAIVEAEPKIAKVLRSC